MKVLWICLLLQSFQQIFAESAFGTPYLANSRTCQQWSCINTKLGLPNSLPPREQFDIALRSILPDGEWQDVVNNVLDTCYGKRTRVYSNTCPGQALLHCTVENLINNCPEPSQRKGDACTPINSFAGMKHMFSQSLYPDIEKNKLNDRRPSWFLKNYFSSKCCNLPPLFNMTVLAECQFTSVINYYRHTMYPNFVPFGSAKTYTTASPPVDTVRIVNPNDNTLESQTYTTASPPVDTVRIVNPNDNTLETQTHTTAFPENAMTIDNPDNNSDQDPLDCCDMSGFIMPSWRSECDFKLSWNHQTRLTIRNSTRDTTVPPSTTTTAAPLLMTDVKVVPVSSENLTCVFNKLNMLTETGDVKLEWYVKLLDNYTKKYEEFTKAKARVITECLTKPLLTYDGASHIEKVVACTLDLLSENYPYYKDENDPCKNPTAGMVCQVSSSRYRAKSRRTPCNLPSLVPQRYLSECGITSLSRMERVVQKIATFKKHVRTYTKIGCLEASQSTLCLMKKMGVLNKYNFIDYFEMKNRIRRYTNESTWSTDRYLSVFTYPPFYGGHCNSPKKLLNVIDSMLMTCPIERRTNSPYCSQIFGTPATHFQHVYEPLSYTSNIYRPIYHEPVKVYYKQKPLYNFGILASGDVPPVKTIDINPATVRPVIPVSLPVYMSLRSPLSQYGVASNMLRGNTGALARNDPILFDA